MIHPDWTHQFEFSILTENQLVEGSIAAKNAVHATERVTEIRDTKYPGATILHIRFLEKQPRKLDTQELEGCQFIHQGRNLYIAQGTIFERGASPLLDKVITREGAWCANEVGGETEIVFAEKKDKYSQSFNRRAKTKKK